MALCGRGFGLARHLLQLRRVLSTGDHLGVGRPGRSLERLRDGSRCVLHGWTPRTPNRSLAPSPSPSMLTCDTVPLTRLVTPRHADGR